MKSFETLDALDDTTRAAVVDLLLRMADDALIIGHRDSQWTGLAPILEEDIAFSSMAQDEMGHAHVYYQMLEQLGQGDPDTLVFVRSVRQWRCAALTYVPNGDDWALSLVRKFLYDTADAVRLGALILGTLKPLSSVAVKLRTEKKYHLMHDRAWMVRLGRATPESAARMQRAVDFIYPYARGLFEPTEADAALERAGICPSERQLEREWASAIAPVLSESGLHVHENVTPVYGARLGRHGQDLKALLDDLQKVHRLDPAAKW